MTSRRLRYQSPDSIQDFCPAAVGDRDAEVHAIVLFRSAHQGHQLGLERAGQFRDPADCVNAHTSTEQCLTFLRKVVTNNVNERIDLDLRASLVLRGERIESEVPQADLKTMVRDLKHSPDAVSVSFGSR